MRFVTLRRGHTMCCYLLRRVVGRLAFRRPSAARVLLDLGELRLLDDTRNITFVRLRLVCGLFPLSQASLRLHVGQICNALCLVQCSLCRCAQRASTECYPRATGAIARRVSSTHEP